MLAEKLCLSLPPQYLRFILVYVFSEIRLADENGISTLVPLYKMEKYYAGNI